jgi:hypothetical protein
MAATARLTAVRNIWSAGLPRATPAANTSAHTTSAATVIRRPSIESRRCSGVGPGGSACSNSATRPSLVAIPVATTTPRLRPPVTAVPRKAMCAARPPVTDDVRQRLGDLAGGLGLAGQGGLVHAQRGHLDQPQVASEHVTLAKQRHVARDQPDGRHQPNVAVAHHLDAGRP